MRHLFATSAVPEDQVSLALARVHGRLRRRRNGLRGAGAAALTCMLLVGLGVASQGQSPPAKAPLGVDAMQSTGSPSEVAPPEDAGVCGHVLASAEVVGLDVTIRQPIEWPTIPMHVGWPQQVIVVARNEGNRPLTISTSASVVGLAHEAVVNTEPSAPVLLPTTVTLEPSEVIELPAGLPQRSCTGDLLGERVYTLAPIVRTEDLGHSPVVVRGSSLSVSHR